MDELAHLAGQISAQVSIQANNQFDQSRQIGNSLTEQIWSLGPRYMDPELVAGRKVLRGRMCHKAEETREERHRHPIHNREKHVLYLAEVNDVPPDTKDQDMIIGNEFSDTRLAFLSLCQGNHYQFNTLRHAKYSSMMVLYHLHNPTALALVTTCNVCHHDTEAGQSWHCESCPKFDVCNACYEKEGAVDHPHKLTNHNKSSIQG